MFLTRIVLEDVRSIEYLDLSLEGGRDGGEPTRRWTFVLGENGTGKSTLLRAVAMVLAGSEALPELVGDPNDWIRFKAPGARIRADLVTADGEERRAELTFKAGDTIRQVYDRNSETLEQLDAAFAHSARSYFTAGYGVSRRPAPEDRAIVRATSPFRHPRARNVATLFSTEAALTSLETWAMDLDYRREAGFEIAQGAIDTLLPDITLARIDRARRELLFETGDGEVPYRLLSEGYQNVAAWTGDLLHQITDVFEDYRDPFAARGLLLIDEMDLHLHPRWQRRLIEFVQTRFRNFQVVATTHSPLTVHQAGEAELYFLTRPEPKAPAELHAYEGAPRNLMLHQLLTSPLFGLTTLDSRDIEMLKDEYRWLRDAERLDAEGQQRLEALSMELVDLPDWSEGIEGDDELRKLLREIRQELG